MKDKCKGCVMIGERQERERILGLIDEDIKYQKSKLVGDFIKDKPIKWRITGFEALKKEIENEK